MNQWHVNEELFQAVFRKDVSAAARILREGSRVNARSIRGYSVIHCAVMNNDLRMVQLLTTHGVDVNLVCNHLKSPLHIAAKYSCEAVTKLLLEHGADPDAESEWGTPLTVAVTENNISVVLMLIRGGSTVTTQSLCQRRRAEHSIMLLRAKLHVLAKDFLQLNDGFKLTFLQGCSRTTTFLGSLYGYTDVLRVMSSFVGVSSTQVVSRVRHLVDFIESVNWENHDEQGFDLAYPSSETDESSDSSESM